MKKKNTQIICIFLMESIHNSVEKNTSTYTSYICKFLKKENKSVERPDTGEGGVVKMVVSSA